MSRYMPVYQYPEMMPVDISFVFEDEKPASNHGQRMDGEKLIDIGTGPIEAEIIDAQIAIKTDNTKLRVCSVNSEGFYIGNPEVTHEDGWMKFHIGSNYPGLYYLIMEY